MLLVYLWPLFPTIFQISCVTWFFCLVLGFSNGFQMLLPLRVNTLEAAGSLQILVNFYQIAWCDIPEDSDIYSRCLENQKSYRCGCRTVFDQMKHTLETRISLRRKTENYIMLIIKADGTENFTSVAIGRYEAVCYWILPSDLWLCFVFKMSKVQIWVQTEDLCCYLLSLQANVGSTWY